MRAVLVALLLSAASAAAEPRAWVIDAGASTLGVVYLINGEKRRGVIRHFEGEARFDPDDLADAELDLVIDMDSVDVGEPFGTMIVKTADWFDVYGHPTARYSLDSLEAKAPGAYIAHGRLTMRGKEHPVTGALSLELGDDVARAGGEAEFPRSLYGIGVGFTALFVEVGDEVGVEFDLIARPKGGQ
mgnify:CR=1 FL=1